MKLWKKKALPTHEELYLANYRQILGWAFQITGGDRQKAEDLVHDVFIQFTLTQPNLSEIENLEGYLFSMLRNLMRAELKHKVLGIGKTISIEDYETAEVSLRLLDLDEQLKARQDLRAICSFLCERKESSKSASALLLRYFLGYFRNEIQLVTKSSENAVDFLLNMACREAKLHLNKPESLGYVKTSKVKLVKESLKTRKSMESEDTFANDSIEDFLRNLNQRIFRTSYGKCLSKRELKELYKDETQKIKVKTLAHIVSCETCIDKVNKILGLPSLSERFPTDTIGRNTPKSSTGGGSGGDDGSGGDEMDNVTDEDAKDSLNQYRKKLRKLTEHEPKELIVAVNGSELGTFSVDSARTKLKFNIEDAEKINFIEIFSEQGVRIVFLNLSDYSVGIFEKEIVVDLSRNRSFEINIGFNATGADLEIFYNHPGYLPVTKAGPELIKELGGEGFNKETDIDDPALSSLNSSESSFEKISSAQQIRNWFDLRRALMTSGVAAVLIAALIFIQLPAENISAAELLNRSTKSEATIAADSTIALHRTLDLEQNDRNGKLVERRRLEVWQSAVRGLKIRRLYDSKGRLIVADWLRKDGSRTLYRPGDKPNEISAISRAEAPKDLDDAWQLDLSADDFSKLVGELDSVTVEENEKTFVLSYANKASELLMNASIVLNRENLRAISQTIRTRTGEGEREFRYTEAKFETPKIEEVPESVFEPEPELVPQEIIEPPKEEETPEESPSPEESPEESLEESPEDEPAPAKAPVKKITSKAEASTALEIEALDLLDKIGATLGQEVTVTRTANQKLRIEGVVSGRKRKQEVLTALSPISSNPALSIRIETPDEAEERLANEQKSGRKTRISIEDVSPASNKIPVDDEVREYFRKKGVSEVRLESRVNKFSVEITSISRKAKLFAWSIRDHANRFSAKKLEQMDADSRNRWLSIVQRQARNYQQEVAKLRSRLVPLFGGGRGSPKSVSSIRNEISLINAMKRLAKLNALTDGAVRGSFTLSGGKSVSVKGADFWRNLRAAEALAGDIERASRDLSSKLKKFN